MRVVSEMQRAIGDCQCICASWRALYYPWSVSRLRNLQQIREANLTARSVRGGQYAFLICKALMSSFHEILKGQARDYAILGNARASRSCSLSCRLRASCSCSHS